MAVVLAATLSLAVPRGAHAVYWDRPGCEPPNVFYSTWQHRIGRSPCCPIVEGVCPSGAACPANGVCADEPVACTPAAAAPADARPRPNVVLMIADDMGSCHYGHAGECRSAQSGTPIPPPVTPNLDLLAGYGTVFPIAHNTASWCFPSLVSALTGRYQKSIMGQQPATGLPTLPRLLRSLGDASTAPPDPYDPDARVGGYCSLLAGKFNGGITPHHAGTTSDTGFQAISSISDRRLGRNPCQASDAGGPPLCGTAATREYRPFTTGKMTDLFEFVDSMLHRVPGSDPAQFAMQPFFIWYAPRIPHQPLVLNNNLPVDQYLFGAPGIYPLGGAMHLGQWCAGPACAPVVPAFYESNFGTERSYYSNVWWMDDNLREIRRFLAAEGAPHCIGSDGRSQFDVATPAQCRGRWSSVTPDPAQNTVLIHLADNGWFLPNSKHSFTENGYRTRLIVFDPRAISDVPPWDPQQAIVPPPAVSQGLASSVDLLPTVMGLALDTPGPQPCPVGPDGTSCDGHDLRPYFATAPGGPAPPETLRHSICGHLTQRPTTPTRSRYLLTRPGSVGRCAPLAGAACTAAADCATGEFCVGGYCAPATPESPCPATGDCPAGSVCLGGACRAAPACIGDDDCTGLLGDGYACVGKPERWCRNAPNASCTTADDCPACPTMNGVAIPCARLCEARSLKLYLGGFAPAYELTDLFLDPDEHGVHDIVPGPGGEPTLVKAMSEAPGYANAARRLSCCIDDWWDGGLGTTSACAPGFSCPPDLVCNQ